MPAATHAPSNPILSCVYVANNNGDSISSFTLSDDQNVTLVSNETVLLSTNPSIWHKVQITSISMASQLVILVIFSQGFMYMKWSVVVL